MPYGGGAVLTSPHFPANEGGFMAGEYRAFTRNDLTQHCISALLKSVRYGLSD